MIESAASGVSQALLIGSGGIGTAVVERWRGEERFSDLWTINRSAPDSEVPGVRRLLTDHSDASITECCQRLRDESTNLTRIVITLGTLHGAGYSPEKSLRQLSGETLSHVYRVNCALPLLWLAGLAPLLRRTHDCRIAILSARVGSISDNSLGGWYSYRSAKAALNMGLKCAAIELARSARGVKLIAYHPGTVDTRLSIPFQSGVSSQQLFSTEQAAKYLGDVMETHAADGELSYVDWSGKLIDW